MPCTWLEHASALPCVKYKYGVHLRLGQNLLGEAFSTFTGACSPTQALGEWDEALKLAESSDRINLQATHYRLAQHHEALGDHAAAIKHYQLSDTHR